MICAAINAFCCACSACQCLFNAFRCSKKSTQARAEYFTMWVVCAVLAWILRDHGHDMLKRIGAMKDCANATCTGNGMVLRITFSMAILSGFIALLVCGVQSAKDPRAVIQNELFPIKWALLIGLILVSVTIDNQDVINFAYVSSVFSGFFLVAGIILVMEFAYNWNDSWTEKMDASSEHRRWWAFWILFCAFVMFGGSVGVWGALISIYGGDECDHANAFVSTTIVLSVIAFILCLFSKNGGVLPCAVMVTYCTYLCASAVIDLPLDRTSQCESRRDGVGASTQEGVYSAGVLFTIFTIGYATIRRASMGNDLSNPAPRKEAAAQHEGDAEAGEVEADEEEGVEYNYTFFHLVYSVGAMYLGMVLTNWTFELEEDERTLGDMSDWTSVWIKMTCSWLSFSLYIWSLVAPWVCPSRF